MLEDLIKRVLAELSAGEGREISLVSLPRELLEEIASLPDREFEDFSLLLQAELVLTGKNPLKEKDLDSLAIVRRAFKVRSSQAIPVCELFPELSGIDLVVPRGYAVTRNGIATIEEEMVSTSPFFVTAKIRERETGHAHYAVKVMAEDSWQELRSACVYGSLGVVKAVMRAGVHVFPKTASRYVDDWLGANWAKLPVVDVAEEAAAIYERLVEMVVMHLDEFLSEKWGRLLTLPQESGKIFVAIPSGRFDGFLRQARCLEARGSILRDWKARGILRVGEGDRYTQRVRICGAILRCVVVLMPPEFAVTGRDRSPVTRQALQIKEEKAL